MAPTGSVERNAAAAARGSTMMKIAAVGLVALGVVHLLIGFIALTLAWGGGNGEEASASGAFATLADQPFGTALLWICAVGLVGLAIWQLSEAVWGHQDKDGGERAFKRVASAAKAIGYLVLGFLAARAAMGASSGGGETEESFTARLLGAPAGQFLVGALGVGIVAVGIYLMHRGVTKAFAKHLDAHSGPGIVRLGQIGHVAKGIAYGVIGVLFVTAAVKHDAAESGGLDEALTKLLEQPYGKWLLSLVALGLMAYGVYAFAWARAMQARS